MRDHAIDNSNLSLEELDAISGLRAAIALAHGTAVNSGWHHDLRTGEPIKRNVGEMICLMHSELSEAMEAHRKSLMDDKLTHRPGVEVELADCVIRIFDFAALHNLDLPGAIIEKNRFNQQRLDHKREHRLASGGKAY